MAAHKPRTIFLLRLLQLNIYNLMVERLRPAGLTPIQYMVLSLLSHRETWSTAELARRFHIAPQSMTEIVALLQRKRLIARSKSLAHGRMLTIRLTAAGMRRLDRCNRAVDRLERAVFADFDAHELARFRDHLGIALLKFVPRRDKRRLATIDAETESANMRVRTAT
jgi:DNA-binding MarR family transcriptional regulator